MCRESGKSGTQMVRSKSGYGVDRVDTVTLKTTAVEPPASEVNDYMTDGRGNVRLMSLAGLDNNGS